MTELMTVIALLCQLHPAVSTDIAQLEARQAACHAYYAACTTTLPMKSLAQCAKERVAD